MAVPSQLPRRVRAVLAEDRDRRAAPARARAATLAVAALACLAVSAAAPASRVEERVPSVSAPVSTVGPAGAAADVPAHDRPAFPTTITADTTPPVLLNQGEVERVLESAYRPLKRAGRSGTALVELALDAGGRVVAARVVDATDRVLGDTAAARLRTARFEPARVDGRAVPYRVRWPVAFNPLEVRRGAAVAAGGEEDRARAALLRELELRAEALAAARPDTAALRAVRAEVEALQARAAEIRTGADDARALAAEVDARALTAADVQARVAEVQARLAETQAARMDSAHAAAAPRRASRAVSDEVLRAALTRYRPEVLERGLDGDQYVWFRVGPSGEVRSSGVAERQDREHLRTSEVLSRFPGLRPAHVQISTLALRPGARETVQVAWIVER